MSSLGFVFYLFFQAVISFLRLLTILFRFFVGAPLTAMFVVMRSPRGIQKDRWIAWRLARAHKMNRRLTPEKLKLLEEFSHRKILREIEEIRIPIGLDDSGRIQWSNTFALA